MITIHWLFLVLIAIGCTFIGVMIMACMFLASRADRIIETYIHDPETGTWQPVK